jgi:hypothetical protein
MSASQYLTPAKMVSAICDNLDAIAESAKIGKHKREILVGLIDDFITEHTAPRQRKSAEEREINRFAAWRALRTQLAIEMHEAELESSGYKRQKGQRKPSRDKESHAETAEAWKLVSATYEDKDGAPYIKLISDYEALKAKQATEAIAREARKAARPSKADQLASKLAKAQLQMETLQAQLAEISDDEE